MYSRHNRRKYSLKVHVVLVTKYRKPILTCKVADTVKLKIAEIADAHEWEIIAMETDRDHIHVMLSYDTTERVCDLVKVIKQMTTHYLWTLFPDMLARNYWKKKILWSNGYFACSVGDVSAEIIKKYIDSQG